MPPFNKQGLRAARVRARAHVCVLCVPVCVRVCVCVCVCVRVCFHNMQRTYKARDNACARARARLCVCMYCLFRHGSC